MINDRPPCVTMHSSSFRRAALLGAVALIAFSSACSTTQDQRPRPGIPVAVAKARVADVPYTLDANGVVTPYRYSNVTAQVGGLVQRVTFREGQDVQKGQVLFVIDPRPYQAAYRQALAALARDRATLANAERDYQRYAALAEQDYVTKEQADQLRATAEAARATVASDEAAVANARFNLENATIRAPIAGRTGALLVREGNVVTANGSSPLVVINQISPILVRFAIPATQLPLLQKFGNVGGLVVSATPNTGSGNSVDTSTQSAIGLSVSGGDPAQRGSGGSGGSGDSASGGSAATGPPVAPPSQLQALSQPEHGTLYFIDNAVDTTTGTVQLKASFANPGKRLWVGEFVATQLRLFVEQNALVVPATAVVTGQQGQYVYVVTDSGTAQQRPVKVERTAGDVVVIASGLRPGEQVVTEGQARLTPNAKVVLNTPVGARQGVAGQRGAGGAGTGAAGATGAGAGAGAGATGPANRAGPAGASQSNAGQAGNAGVSRGAGRPPSP
jgi:multidrug efflux system membrane fusion protein